MVVGVLTCFGGWFFVFAVGAGELGRGVMGM